LRHQGFFHRRQGKAVFLAVVIIVIAVGFFSYGRAFFACVVLLIVIVAAGVSFSFDDRSGRRARVIRWLFVTDGSIFAIYLLSVTVGNNLSRINDRVTAICCVQINNITQQNVALQQ